MKDIKRGLWLIAIGVWLLVGSTFVYAEEVYPEKEWVWGCQIKGRTLDGNCRMTRFTKVGETENDVDTDEPRVLGFEPGNVVTNKDGKPIWMRIREPLFLRPGEVKLVSAAKCSCGR